MMNLLDMVNKVSSSKEAPKVVAGSSKKIASQFKDEPYTNDIDYNQYRSNIAQKVIEFNQNLNISKEPNVISAVQNSNKNQPTVVVTEVTTNQNKTKVTNIYDNISIAEYDIPEPLQKPLLIDSATNSNKTLSYDVLYYKEDTKDIFVSDTWDNYQKAETKEVVYEDTWNNYQKIKTKPIKTISTWDNYQDLETKKIETDNPWNKYSDIQSSTVVHEDTWNNYDNTNIPKVEANNSSASNSEWEDFQQQFKEVPKNANIYDYKNNRYNYNALLENAQKANKKPLRPEIASNQSEYGILDNSTAYEGTELQHLGNVPVVGDIIGIGQSLVGSSILWQSYKKMGKVGLDTFQKFYKLAWANINLAGMTGRFVPQPPNTNSLKWLVSSSKILGSVNPALKDKLNQFAATIPSYPYIPLPNFTASYKVFKPEQQPSDVNYQFNTGIKPHTNTLDVNPLENIEKRLKEEIPDFSYDDIEAFEGRIPKYSLFISNENLEDLPPFTDYTNQAELSSYTTIKNIPSASLKTDNKFKMAGFGDFLLGLSYNDYIGEIATVTKETADCSVYYWAKKYLEYMYGNSNNQPLDNFKHRSIYLGYYNIKISKIYFTNKDQDGRDILQTRALRNQKTIARVIESRIFYGVPTFDLSESVDKTSLTDMEIKWNIIGNEKIVKKYQILSDELGSKYPIWKERY